jgi:hypothetical protein
MKKLILKERQVKYIIDNLIENVIYEQKRTETETVPLQVNWLMGKWKLNAEHIGKLRQQVTPIVEFINKHKDSQVVIQIESGESQITNYNTEVSPKEELDPGQLSTFRGNSMVEYLKSLFKTFKEQGLISKEPEIPQPNTIIGTTKYIKFSTNPESKDHKFYLSNLQNYKNEQFVRAVLSLKKDYNCLVGLEVTIGYFREADSLGRKSKSNHFCDESIFELKMNGVSIGVVNLNNQYGDVAAYALLNGDDEMYEQNLDAFLKVGVNTPMIRGKSAQDSRVRRGVYVQLASKKEVKNEKGEIVEPGPITTLQNFLKKVYDITPNRFTDNKIAGTRYATFKISPEQAQSIVGESDEITLSIVPLVKEGGDFDLLYQAGSHSDVPFVTIKNKENDILYNDEPNITMQRGDTSEKVLLRLDGCGEPLTKQ